MTKCSVTISIDPEINAAFQTKFPRQRSSMVEDFMREMLDAETDSKNPEDVYKKIVDDMTMVSSDIQKLKSREKILQIQLKDFEEKEKFTLSIDEETWIKQYGLKIIENKSIAESLAGFMRIFKRYTYPMANYKEDIERIAKEVEE